MKYVDATKRLNEYRERIGALRGEMRKLQVEIEPQQVENYAFATTRGTVRLAELFGGRKDLFVVHNMGASCPYCTLWADGFNGAYDHVANRAAFVVSSPDAPEAQERFAAGRGWRFPMVSHQGSSFAQDMGYCAANGGWMPGVSVFRREGARILRVADSGFSPGDDFCALWHFLDLLPEGADGWGPKFRYA